MLDKMIRSAVQGPVFLYRKVAHYFGQESTDDVAQVQNPILTQELLDSAAILLEEDHKRWGFVRNDLWYTAILLVLMLAASRVESTVFDDYHLIHYMMYVVATCGVLFNGVGLQTLYKEVMPRTRTTLQALLHSTDHDNLMRSDAQHLYNDALSLVNQHYQKCRGRVFIDEWGTYAIFIGALITGGQIDRYLTGEWSPFLNTALYASLLGIAGNVFAYYQLWAHTEPYNTQACDKLERSLTMPPITVRSDVAKASEAENRLSVHESSAKPGAQAKVKAAS